MLGRFEDGDCPCLVAVLAAGHRVCSAHTNGQLMNAGKILVSSRLPHEKDFINRNGKENRQNIPMKACPLVSEKSQVNISFSSVETPFSEREGFFSKMSSCDKRQNLGFESPDGMMAPYSRQNDFALAVQRGNWASSFGPCPLSRRFTATSTLQLPHRPVTEFAPRPAKDGRWGTALASRRR